MSSLDSRFINTSDLESYFVDKTTGEPLAAGTVTFYSDLNRNQLKPVYQMTDNGMGTYTYTALPNPSTLSTVGTFQDGSANNITPYYFPYQGTPTNTTNVIELYHIVVKNSAGVQQFTRSGWPNIAPDTSGDSTEFKNYIPNGQFLFHNNNPVTNSNVSGIDITYLAQGGWEFRRTNGGTSTFTNSFVSLNPTGIGLNDFPKFSYNSVCSVFNAGDTVRDLFIKFPGVNTFSSGTTPGQQDYTLFLAGESNDGGNYAFDIYLVRNYGTGGTPTANPGDELLGQITFTNNYSYFTVQNINFLANNNVTLGTNNDDYVGIALRGPSSTWNIQCTDFALCKGSVTLNNFPIQTEADMHAEGIAGWMPTPNPDGSDLYLPLVLTPTGMTFDDSSIGEIIGLFNDNTPGGNTLPCDGTSYLVSGYHSTGIPYQRLFNKWFDIDVQGSKFGSGPDFVNVTGNLGSTGMIIVGTNKAGSVTNPSDGAITTGFTFNTIVNAGTAGYNYFANCAGNGGATVTAVSNFVNGAAAAADAGTSGMTVYSYRQYYATNCYYAFRISALDASALGNGGGTGKYFSFSDNTTTYIFWFHTATETAPVVAGTKVRVNLDLSMLSGEVANIIACTIAGMQTNTITIAAQPSSAGSYFQFYANSLPYIVWYEINNSGTQPVVGGTTAYIKVALTGSENAAQIASLTRRAMNSYLFLVPDLGGLFLRGKDTFEQWDYEVGYRFGLFNGIPADASGTFQVDSSVTHNHVPELGNGDIVGVTAGGAGNTYVGTAADVGLGTTLSFFGGAETRSVNVCVNWYVRF